jgi:Ala-tRNA(Pro) deacylase
MAATEQELLARLAALGIETTTHRHPAVFTVEEAQARCGHLPGAHCKNLFMKDKKGALWLLVTYDERPVDIKSLQKALGAARLSFGKPDLLAAVLGVSPGSVTPFGLINDTEQQVTVALDRAMMQEPLLNYHPLTNEATTALSPDGLRRFIADCGHTPVELDLGPAPGQ